MTKYAKILTPLSIFLLISIFFRLYKAPTFFLYSHDQDLASWFIKDVVENHHFRLVGQETSTPGIFIGPYFYYFLLPFYLLYKMDPIGGVVAVAVLGLITTTSFYYIFSKMFGKNAGILAAFFHATSYFIVLNEKEVVPTQPVVLLWTLWFFFSIWQIQQGKQKFIILLALLLSFVWSINMGLILLLPLIPLAYLLQSKNIRKSLNIKVHLAALFVLILLSIPLILFEVRHGFTESHALLNSLTTNQKDIVSGADKIARVFHLTAKNISNLFLGDLPNIRYWHSFAAIAIAYIYLTLKKRITKRVSVLMLIWFILTFIFFSLYSKILSEYYLNGLMVIWFTIFVLTVENLLQKGKYQKTLGVLLVLIFTFLNLYRFIHYPINRSGYLERKQVAQFIKDDSEAHGYPCVAISYITNPGYNLGYRYFFHILKMHVNNPVSGSPVYTIVFPQSMVDRIDVGVGALGVIKPDYMRYNRESVEKSCSGANSNETDPLFGFPAK